MKVNVYYEAVAVINKLWIAGTLVKEDYGLVAGSTAYSVFDSDERGFNIKVSKWKQLNHFEEDKKICIIRATSPFSEDQEVYNGPLYANQKDWRKIVMLILSKCKPKVRKMYEALELLLPKMYIANESIVVETRPRYIISSISRLWEKAYIMEEEGKYILKRFANDPSRFNIYNFDEGSIVIERVWNSANLNSYEKEIFECKSRDEEPDLYDSVTPLPIRIFYISRKFQELFSECLRGEIVVNVSGLFPPTPIFELTTIIPPEIYGILVMNSVKKIGGSWWEGNSGQEGIWINYLEYFNERKR